MIRPNVGSTGHRQKDKALTPGLSGLALRSGEQLAHPSDGVPECLASPEEYGALRRNLDPSPGLWIEADARPTLSDSEAAQSAKLDLLASNEGVRDAIEDRLDEGLGFLLREAPLLRQFVDQVGFRYGLGSSAPKHS